MAELRPWERDTGSETGKAFHAFSVYLALGPNRSIAKAWAEYQRQNSGGTAVSKKLPRHWETWSVAHNWVVRAEAWDCEMASQARKAQAETWKARARELGKAERERLTIQRALHSGGSRVAAKGLSEIIRRQENDEAMMTVADLSRLLRSLALVGEMTFAADLELLSIDKVISWYHDAQGD